MGKGAQRPARRLPALAPVRPAISAEEQRRRRHQLGRALAEPAEGPRRLLIGTPEAGPARWLFEELLDIGAPPRLRFIGSLDALVDDVLRTFRTFRSTEPLIRCGILYDLDDPGYPSTPAPIAPQVTIEFDPDAHVPDRAGDFYREQLQRVLHALYPDVFVDRGLTQEVRRHLVLRVSAAPEPLPIGADAPPVRAVNTFDTAEEAAAFARTLDLRVGRWAAYYDLAESMPRLRSTIALEWRTSDGPVRLRF